MTVSVSPIPISASRFRNSCASPSPQPIVPASKTCAAPGCTSRRNPEHSSAMSEMPSGPTSTKATCSMTSRAWPSRLSRKRQLSRVLGPICWELESSTSNSVVGANQPRKRSAISSRPERTSGPRGRSIRACADGARHSANPPKSRTERAARKASVADGSGMPTKVVTVWSTAHQPFGRSSPEERRRHETDQRRLNAPPVNEPPGAPLFARKLQLSRGEQGWRWSLRSRRHPGSLQRVITAEIPPAHTAPGKEPEERSPQAGEPSRIRR